MNSPTFSLIIPTLNEAHNIATLIERAQEQLQPFDYEIVIVDDQSVDGTIPIVEALARRDPNIRLVVRSRARGLSSAVLEGMRVARGSIFGVMDADLSHDERLLPRFIKAIQSGADMAIGSRRLPGGGADHWPWHRRLTSRLATQLTLWWLDVPLSDPMSGFFALKRTLYEACHASLEPKGYKIMLEIYCKAGPSRITELPFIFKDRRQDHSKLTPRVMVQFLQSLYQLRVHVPKRPPPESIEAKMAFDNFQTLSTSRSERSSLRSHVLVPFVAWLASKGIVCLAAHSLALPLSDPMTWARWDSFSFLTIALRGYYIFPDLRTLNHHTTFWNGNTGSFPLYSYLIQAFDGPQALTPWIAISVSSFFHFASLFLLWNAWIKHETQQRALLLMGMAAMFPGMVYCHAISSVSLFIFLSMSYLRLASQARWKAAGLAGALAGVAHTTSIFLIPTMVLWMLIRWSETRNDTAKMLGVTLSPLLGVAVVFYIQRLQTGVWDSAARIWAFHRYVNEWNILRFRQMLYIPTLSQPSTATKVYVILQSVSVAAMCVMALYYYLQKKDSGYQERHVQEYSLFLIFTLLFWLAPHFSGFHHSYYRNEAYLLPGLILMGNVPRSVLLGILILWSILAFCMAQQFFLGILI